MKKLVIFTGAGISAESGLKTFRDADGLWEGFDVHEVATPRGWKKNPELVLRFYNERRQNVKDAKPNRAHEIIAELEQFFYVHVITQNIDDLHERAGSKNTLHLHGEIFKMRSEKNDAIIYPISGDINLGDIAPDGFQLRPHIVWFEEPVPMMDDALLLASMADIFVVIGTSLVVYPAASILNYLAPSTPVIVVDKKVPKVNRKDVTNIEMPATEGMEELKKILLEKYI
jgi:NAD-dependent deacetylase